jgi:hypothetical protein
MRTATPFLSPVLHDIHVNVVSASLGVAEFWSGDRLVGFTRIEDGDFAPADRASPDGVVLGATPSPRRSRRLTASSPSTDYTRKA